MNSAPPPSGLEAVFLENRDKLLRFLRARGAGDAAEDLVQEVWLKIAGRKPGPISAPLPYLFRTADLLMVDRFRSNTQARAREREWTDGNTGWPPEASEEPSAERSLAATQEATKVLALLDRLGPRVATVFRRHRVDGIAQKAIATELGVSLSTIEGDLRTAYKALSEWKERGN